MGRLSAQSLPRFLIVTLVLSLSGLVTIWRSYDHWPAEPGSVNAGRLMIPPTDADTRPLGSCFEDTGIF